MRKTNIILTCTVFSLILVFGSIAPSYAEYMSPKKQIESGILPEDVICRDGKVLTIRDNSKVACVTERTAEKLTWKIINTVFEKTFEENLLNSISFDLSGIKTQSDVLEGDYETGLYTESMKGVIRTPPPIPFATEINYVVNQDGSSDFSKMGSLETQSAIVSFSASESKTKTPEDYLKYFPEYIPDGQELKFFTFEGHELGAKLLLVYAPIVVSVDPLELDQGKLLDLGGIIVLIEDTPDTWHDKENPFDWHIENGGELIQINNNTVVKGAIQILWENSNGITFHFNSYSYTGTEMLRMAETTLAEN